MAARNRTGIWIVVASVVVLGFVGFLFLNDQSEEAAVSNQPVPATNIEAAYKANLSASREFSADFNACQTATFGYAELTLDGEKYPLGEGLSARATELDGLVLRCRAATQKRWHGEASEWCGNIISHASRNAESVSAIAPLNIENVRHNPGYFRGDAIADIDPYLEDANSLWEPYFNAVANRHCLASSPDPTTDTARSSQP